MPFWHYLPTIAAGEEQTTYYAIDALGARSADAPISVVLGPAVDRLPTCHPSSWSTYPAFNPIYSRPGATRRFAVMCDDADGDALQPRLTSAPTRGAFADFAPELPSHGFWGTEVWVDVTYVPHSSHEGEDRFAVTATGTRGDGPAGQMGIVSRALPANSGAGCGWSPGSTKPGVPVTLEATCEDTDGDPVHRPSTRSGRRSRGPSCSPGPRRRGIPPSARRCRSPRWTRRARRSGPAASGSSPASATPASTDRAPRCRPPSGRARWPSPARCAAT